MGWQRRHGGTGRMTGTAVAAVAVVAAALLQPAAASAAGRPAAAAGARPAGQRVGHGPESAVISRDRYGVPTVTGSTLAGMWFGSGWAQAQDRMAQLELTRRAVEGTLAQIFGSGELGQDETVRTIFYTRAGLRAQFRTLPAATRRAITAFSAGINAYERYAYGSAQRLVPVEFFALGQALGLSGPYRPAPWRPVDTVAVGNYLAREFGGGGGSELQNLSFLTYLQAELTAKGDAQPGRDAGAIFNDARWIDDTTAPTTVPGPDRASTGRASGPARSSLPARQLAGLSRISGAQVRAAERALAADRHRILATGISLKVLAHGGSDAFAVAPWRSAGRHALLWGAPQEGFGTPSVDGEEYLHAPGYDAGGMYITGEPFVLIGRNARLAWTTTSEETVDQRIYAMQVNVATSPPTYKFDGRWRPVRVLTEHIPVAGGPAQTFTVYRTVDGPLIAPPANGVAFALRFASWDRETGSLAGFSQLGGDANLRQFARSMRLVTTLHNFLYADRAGNIAFFGDGIVPVDAAGVDPRLPALGDGTEQPGRGGAVARHAPQHQPGAGLPGQLEHQAFGPGVLPAKRGR